MARTYNDNWNRLVWFSQNCKDDKLKKHSSILLSSLNTASGIRIKSEVESFLRTNAVPENVTFK